MTAREILQHLDEAETVAVDFIAKVVTWLAPLAAAVLIVLALVGEPLNYSLPVAVLVAAVVELTGLAFVATALRFFFDWRGTAAPVVGFAVSTAATVVYLAAALLAVLVVKLLPAAAGVLPALLVVLSVASAVVASVRSSTQRAALTTSPPQPERRKRKAGASGRSNKRPTEQTNEERQANLAQANAVRDEIIEQRRERVLEMHRAGKSQVAIARALDVSASTIKRDLMALNGQVEVSR